MIHATMQTQIEYAINDPVPFQVHAAVNEEPPGLPLRPRATGAVNQGGMAVSMVLMVAQKNPHLCPLMSWPKES